MFKYYNWKIFKSVSSSTHLLNTTHLIFSAEFPMSSVDSTYSLDKRTTNASNDPSYDSKHPKTGKT